MDAPLRLGGGHALHAVATGLVTQHAPSTFAFHGKDDLFVAAYFAGREIKVLDAQTFGLEPAAVDAVQIRGEQRGLITTGACTDFDDDLGALVFGFAHQLVEHTALEVFGTGSELTQLVLRQRQQLAIAAFDQRARLGLALQARLKLRAQVRSALQHAALDTKTSQALAIAGDLRR